jgi:hypothetical protein
VDFTLSKIRTANPSFFANIRQVSEPPPYPSQYRI